MFDKIENSNPMRQLTYVKASCKKQNDLGIALFS